MTHKFTNRSMIFLLAIPLALSCLLGCWGITEVARRFGLQPRGQTDAYLSQFSASNQPVPMSDAGQLTDDEAAQALDAVTIEIWFLDGPTTFYDDEIFAERLERSQTPEDGLVYLIEFDEAGVNQYLNYWFGGGIESGLENVWFDLKPGGIVMYADVDLNGQWQRSGAVFHLDETQRQFVFDGVDIDGQLYAAPPYGPVAESFTLLEKSGNRALRELKFVDADGELYIEQIVLSEDGAVILAR